MSWKPYLALVSKISPEIKLTLIRLFRSCIKSSAAVLLLLESNNSNSFKMVGFRNIFLSEPDGEILITPGMVLMIVLYNAYLQLLVLPV